MTEKRSKAQWVAILGAQERSGQSALRFCREQGLVYKTFLDRRKTIKRGGRQLATVRTFPGMSVSGRFLPIRVEETLGIRLQFPMGLVLESDGLPSASWVVEVAERWLEPPPC